MIKKIFKKTMSVIITAMLILSACTVGASAASVNESTDINNYGDVITNDELGELYSYSGYITKENLLNLKDNSVSAGSHKPTFEYCVDANGQYIVNQKTMVGQYKGGIAMMIKFDGKHAYCIEPGEPLFTDSSMNDTSAVYGKLNRNQQNALNVAMCYGLDGNNDYVVSGGISEGEAYSANQLIVWEIVKGERNATAPFALKSGKKGYLSLYSNKNVKTAYNRIVKGMGSFQKLPSFMSQSKKSPTEINLTANYFEASDKWTYSTVVKNDDNKVLSSNFKSITGTYDVGNAKVKVTQDGNKVKFEIVKGSVDLNADSSPVTLSNNKINIPTKCTTGALIGYGSSAYQDCITGGAIDPPEAYLKLSVNVSKHGITHDGNIQKSCWTETEAEDDETKNGEGSLSNAQNLEGWYFYVDVPKDFETKYKVDHIVLGPTNELGITGTVSEYIIKNIDKNCSYDVPTGYYDIYELGKLKEGASGKDYKNDYYFPEHWRHQFDCGYGSEYPSGTLRIEAANSTEFITAFVNNIYDIQLEIIKTCEDFNDTVGQYLKGYYFELTNTATSETLIVGPTNIHGKIECTPAEGTYIVKELGKKNADGTYSIPAQYDEPTEIEVEISADAYKNAQESGYDAIPLNFVNTCSSYLAIVKSDSETAKKLADAVYGVYTDENALNLIDTLTTGKDGYAQTESKYSTGTYYIKEITPPPGYTKNDTIYTVDVKPTSNVDNVVQIEVEDKPIITEISKTDITGETELDGATLEVKDSKGNVIDEWVSSKTAHIIKGLVINETYTLTEKISPDGYTIATSIQFTVKNDGTVTKVVMKDDTTKYSLIKVDEQGNPLSGAVLQLIDDNGKVIDEWTTNGKPHEVIGKLVVGKTYTLHEKSVPNGYVRAEDISFTVDNLSTIQTIKMVDKITVTEISKTDITGENELEGATLIVTDNDGNVIDEWVSTNTAHIIKGLTAGETYTLTEKISPAGYTIANSIEFTVKDDGSVTKVVMKDDTTKYSFIKIDEQGNPLNGAVLQLIDDNGKVIDEWTTNGTPYEVFGKLVVGKTYTLHEKLAPNGYVLADDITFTVGNTPDIQTIEMVDILTVTEISKTDITGETELAKAKLVITDKKGTVIEEWVSTTMPHKVKGLIAGETYILTEIIAPDGYTIANSIEFTVNSDGTTTKVVMKDDTTKYSFVKFDSEGNMLRGAVLQLLDEKGNIVEEWMTDGKPHEIIGKLVVGKKYTLHEKSAPEGYDLANDITFTVNNTSSLQTIKMVDEYNGDLSISTPDLPVIEDNDDNDGYITTGQKPMFFTFFTLVASAAVLYYSRRKKQ